jgi:hypothetical protein
MTRRAGMRDSADRIVMARTEYVVDTLAKIFLSRVVGAFSQL